MKFCKKYRFDFLSWGNDQILMILIHLVCINKVLKLTKGQGHKVKGQGHICKCVEIESSIYHQPIIGYWWHLRTWLITDVEVYLRSRLQGQRSRTNMQLSKKLVLTLYHEPMIGYWWYLYTWYALMGWGSWLPRSQGQRLRSNMQFCKKNHLFWLCIMNQ